MDAALRARDGVVESRGGGQRMLPVPNQLYSIHTLAIAIVVTTISIFVLAYYLNLPDPRTSPDTPSYLSVAEKIRDGGTVSDPYRTPGYPAFIAVIFLIFGSGDLQALSIAQGVLFVLTALEIYAITFLIARRAWIAITVALAASVNTYQLSYAKGIIVEGFALWTVVTFVLAVVLFLRRPSPRGLWLVASALLLAFMTRTEWLYVVVPLFAFLLVATWRLGVARRLALHAVAATVVLYGVLGLYITTNGPENGYGPFVVIPRIVLLGKVFQYEMQEAAPAKYQDLTRRITAYLAEGDQGPYVFADRNPEVSAHYWELAGEYGRAVVRNDPLEYLWKTVKFAHTGTTYRWGFGEIDDDAIFGSELGYLERVSNDVYEKYRYFPAVAGACLIAWLCALLRRKEYASRITMMAALAFLGLYQLFMSTAGGYADWPRLFMTLNPVRIIVTFGSVLILVALLARLLEGRARSFLVRYERAVLPALVGVLAIVALVFLEVPTSTRAWIKGHPLETLSVGGACVWLTLLAWRARQTATRQAGDPT